MSVMKFYNLYILDTWHSHSLPFTPIHPHSLPFTPIHSHSLTHFTYSQDYYIFTIYLHACIYIYVYTCTYMYVYIHMTIYEYI